MEKYAGITRDHSYTCNPILHGGAVCLNKGRCETPYFELRDVLMIWSWLLETHCIPIISYAIEVIHVVDRNEKRQLRVAYNAVYRKMFGYNYRESVSLLQRSLGRPTWEELVERRTTAFHNRLRQCPSNSLLRAFIWKFLCRLTIFALNHAPYIPSVFISCFAMVKDCIS